jgi:outer membrane protein
MKREIDNTMGKKLQTIIASAIVFCFLSLTVVPNAFTQDFKVGYVDPRVILEQMPEARAVQQEIQNFYDRKQNEIATTQQELQTELQAFQQKVGVLSEEARQTEEERLTQMDLEFRQLQSDAQTEIQQKSAELMDPLFDQIQASVDNVAKDLGLDMIINVTMGGYNILDRNIIYISPENQTDFNITSAVMQDLGI